MFRYIIITKVVFLEGDEVLDHEDRPSTFFDVFTSIKRVRSNIKETRPEKDEYVSKK